MPGAYLHGFDETTGAKVMCRVTSDGKLIVNAASIVENPPTEDEAKKAPTSEWAFDHDADAAAHHAKYTDVESRAAIGNLFNPSGQALKDLAMCYKAINYANPFSFRASGADRSIISFNKSGGYEIMNMTCNRPGVGLVDWVFRIYNGSAYTNIIRQDTFQAELDDYLENPPTQDVANKAPTSEWAFDHDADAAAHHTKYTDKEAVDAFGSRSLTLTNGTYDSEDVSVKSMIYLDTTDGDIILRGLAGGYDGQVIFGVKTVATNDVYLYHEHATPAAGNKIRTLSAVNESLQVGHYGGFTLVYKGSYWHSLGYVA